MSGLDLLGLAGRVSILWVGVLRKNARVVNRARCILGEFSTLGGGLMRARTGFCLRGVWEMVWESSSLAGTNVLVVSLFLHTSLKKNATNMHSSLKCTFKLFLRVSFSYLSFLLSDPGHPIL